MKRHIFSWRGLLVLAVIVAQIVILANIFHVGKAAGVVNPAQYVNPFTGTSGQGNTFPGADAPFGMIQWGPDTPSAQSGGSYNYSDTTINDFSLTHLSGAGCSIYQDIPFMPFVGAVKKSPGSNFSAYASTFSHSSEVAQPGYYSVLLNTPNVKTELTVTPRTGFGQFTYPSSTASTMLISATSANGNSAATVSINASSHQVTGSAKSSKFCAQNGSYTIYFAALFNQPFTSFGTWKGSTLSAGSTTNGGAQSGAYVTFDTTQNPVTQVKVGVSFVSVANALANVQAENAGWDFTSVRTAATTSWNSALSAIQVSGGLAADVNTFYTNLYQSLLFPSIFSDANGQYIGFDHQVYTTVAGHAQYANYSGWDIYHSQIALLATLFPARTSDMMQSLVNDYVQSGCLPKWSVANFHTDVEDGDSADPIIAEAFAFGARGFDTTTALQAMLKGATKTCTSSGYIERQGLSQYLSLGYIPEGTAGLNGSASATLEYTTDDFAISQFANALGDAATAATFAKRAENWQKLFDTAKGSIEPRDSNGNFVVDPKGLAGFHGGSDAQYTLMVPYNVGGLFHAMGGNQQAISRLNTFFTQLNAGKTSKYANLGNEPSLSAPWEYDFVGQPWQTQSVVRRAMTQLYSATPGGEPGNNDLGELSSWYVWSALGFFPLYPGVGDVVLNSPLFAQTTLNVGGHQVQITASGAADNAPYVQSLSVNNQASTQLWQPFSVLSNGGTFQFTLGSSANTSWGNNPADAPPSF